MHTSARAEHKLVFVSVILLLITVACDVDPSPTPTPIVTIEIVGNTHPEVRVIRIEVIAQNNCGGTAEVENEIEKSRSIAHTIEVGTGLEVNANGEIGFAGTGVELGATVATQFGYSYGSVENISRSITVKAKEGTYMEHQVKLQEVWEIGTAKVVVNGQELEVPFSFRTDFAVELVDSKEIKGKCPSPPTPVKTPTPTNTPEPIESEPLTPANTLEPSPIPAPTHTPEPPPPPSPTPLPSVLSVGQPWQQGGVVLHLQDSFFVLNGAIECECVNFVFDLFNRNPNEILVTIEPWQFSAQDNFGNNLELVTVATHTFCSYLRPLNTLKTSIAPGDSFYMGGYRTWSVSFCGALTSSDYVILTVNGLAGVNNAKWKLPLK